MKKIIIGFVILGAFVSCQKDDINPSSAEKTCNCYERHEAIKTYKGSNGMTEVGWLFDYNTNSQPDLCVKATGEWVYSGNPTSQRYKVICN
jgi:hypothetical protein